MTDADDRPADVPDPAVPPPPPSAPPPVPPRPPASAPRPPAGRPSWLRTSLTFKILAIGAIVVLLAIPLMLLRGLIAEREQMRDTARREVAAQWGQAQSIGGPVLTIPYTATETTGDSGSQRTTTVTRYLHVFPDRLDARGRLTTEVRTRGIFRVVLYNTGLDLSGAFPSMPAILADAEALGIEGDALRLDGAFLQVGITDMVGIRDVVRVRWNGAVREADPGLASRDVFGSGLSAPVEIAEDDSAATFAVRLDLNGSRSLGVLPVGKETTLEMAGDWGTPRFAGAFLPAQRTVRPDGFAASWRVLHLNRNYPQVFTGAFGRPTALDADVDVASWDSPRGMPSDYMDLAATGGSSGAPSAFGVELLLPVDEYQKASRAAEYGMLFVLLTFLTFFLVEVLGNRRIHPVQYLLVGFAVTLFYLLLLAFAEYAPFNGAYAMAAAAILALVTLYARAVFGGWRLALLVGGLLAMFYGYFFVLLQLEAYALLVGSLGLLVTLAAVMYLSRRVDWYGDGGERVVE